MEKTIKTVKIIFSIVSVIMLAIAIYSLIATVSFKQKATLVSGTIKDVIVSIEETDSNDFNSNSSTRTKQKMYMYQPVIEFTSSTGENIEFVSPVKSSTPDVPGSTIEILYNEEHPEQAKENSFFALWGVSLICGVLGTLFGIFPLVSFIMSKGSKQKLNDLKLNGTRIVADINDVYENTAVSINGQHPYKIKAHWQDPMTQRLHAFSSANIYYNPSKFIKSNQIEVLIDPKNPRRYHVDTAFLPTEV